MLVSFFIMEYESVLQGVPGNHSIKEIGTKKLLEVFKMASPPRKGEYVEIGGKKYVTDTPRYIPDYAVPGETGVFCAEVFVSPQGW